MDATPARSSSSASPSPVRLWRPAAQRNIRNQWSRLRAAVMDRWPAAASHGRAHATSLVNLYLQHRYLPQMDLGVLADLPEIREKSAEKLVKQQDEICIKLLQSYKDMVVIVADLVKAARSMRSFVKGSISSGLIQFCDYPTDGNDFGDGGGIPVFSHFDISTLEKLARDLAEMFNQELALKRLIVAGLLLTTWKQALEGCVKKFDWSDEIYVGEFDDMKTIELLSTDSSQLPQLLPSVMKDWDPGRSNPFFERSHTAPSRETLEVYLTVWLADVNINMHRVKEVFEMVEGDMQV